MIIYEVHINHEHHLFPSYILTTSGNIARYNLSLMNHIYIWKIQFHMAGGKEDRPSLLFSLIHFFSWNNFTHTDHIADLITTLMGTCFIFYYLFILFYIYIYIFIYWEGGGDSPLMYFTICCRRILTKAAWSALNVALVNHLIHWLNVHLEQYVYTSGPYKSTLLSAAT